MANPQKENGYTAIANELVDALARIRISGEAMQIFWVILRKTYGFQKKEDVISLSQFCHATGLNKQSAHRAIGTLISLNIIDKKAYGVSNKYCIIKDFTTWKPLPKKITVDKKDKGVDKKDNKSRQKRYIQKKKETYTKEIDHLASKDAALVVELIDSFSEINQAYKKWYARPPQRMAASRLIATHGLEQVKRVIKLLPVSNTIPYFPTITTPLELEDKWSKLESAWKRKKNEVDEKNAKHKVAF